MRRVLIPIGIALILFAITSYFVLYNGDSMNQYSFEREPVKLIVREGSSHAPVEYGSPVWSQFDVTFEGRRQHVLIKEYIQPEPLRRIIDREKKSPQGRRSPSSLFAFYYDSFSNVSTKKEFLSLGQSFTADPILWRNTIESNVQLLSGGSWDDYLDLIRNIYLKNCNNAVVLGEVIAGNYHIYIYRRGPEYPPTYYVYIKKQDGLYYIFPEWPGDVRPLLVNGPILHLFPTIEMHVR